MSLHGSAHGAQKFNKDTRSRSAERISWKCAGDSTMYAFVEVPLVLDIVASIFPSRLRRVYAAAVGMYFDGEWICKWCQNVIQDDSRWESGGKRQGDVEAWTTREVTALLCVCKKDPSYCNHIATFRIQPTQHTLITHLPPPSIEIRTHDGENKPQPACTKKIKGTQGPICYQIRHAPKTSIHVLWECFLLSRSQFSLQQSLDRIGKSPHFVLELCLMAMRKWSAVFVASVVCLLCFASPCCTELSEFAQHWQRIHLHM